MPRNGVSAAMSVRWAQMASHRPRAVDCDDAAGLRNLLGSASEHTANEEVA
jgi:hypothetical protein